MVVFFSLSYVFLCGIAEVMCGTCEVWSVEACRHSEKWQWNFAKEPKRSAPQCFYGFDILISYEFFCQLFVGCCACVSHIYHSDTNIYIQYYPHTHTHTLHTCIKSSSAFKRIIKLLNMYPDGTYGTGDRRPSAPVYLFLRFEFQIVPNIEDWSCHFAKLLCVLTFNQNIFLFFFSFFFFYPLKFAQEQLLECQIFFPLGTCGHSWFYVGFSIWAIMAILATFTIRLWLIQIQRIGMNRILSLFFLILENKIIIRLVSSSFPDIHNIIRMHCDHIRFGVFVFYTSQLVILFSKYICLGAVCLACR